MFFVICLLAQDSLPETCPLLTAERHAAFCFGFGEKLALCSFPKCFAITHKHVDASLYLQQIVTT